MEVIMPRVDNTCLEIRSSINGPFIHQNRKLYVALTCDSRCESIPGLEILIRQLARFKTKGLDDLPDALVKLGSPSFDDVMAEVESLIAPGLTSITETRMTRPPLREKRRIVAPSEPKVEEFDPSGFEPGEYEIMIQQLDGKRRVLFSDVFIVVDEVTCVLHGLDRMSRPAYQPLDQSLEKVDVLQLVEEIREAREQHLRSKARGSVRYSVETLHKANVKTVREQLTAEISTLLGYAERMVFFDGEICVRILPNTGSDDFKLDIDVKGGKYFDRRTGLEEILISISPDLRLGGADVESKRDRATISYTFGR